MNIFNKNIKKKYCNKSYRKFQKITIESSFLKDWREIQKKSLEDAQYIWSEDKDISLQYFNVLKRMIHSIPRKVHISEEYNCPKIYETAASEIINKLEKGESVLPYLSRGLKKAYNHDQLLNHWGIHHFHLGESFEDDGFIKRTGPLMYVFIDESKAYILGILNHGEWLNRQLLTILHNNWPDSIKKYKLNGISPKEIDGISLKKLRKGNVNTLISISENVYAPLGGGTATSGINCEVVICSDFYHRWIMDLEKSFKLHFFTKIPRKERKIVKKQLYKNSINKIELNLFREKENFYLKDKQNIIQVNIENKCS